MENGKPLNAVNGKLLFTRYATGVTNWRHKLRGIDGNKKPIQFNPNEKRAIKKGLERMLKDIKAQL